MAIANDTSAIEPAAVAAEACRAPGDSSQSQPSGFGPGRERRRAVRFKRKFVSQMTPWSAGQAAVPFQVVIEDISDHGIGILHSEPLEVGVRHLLTVPREVGRAVIRQVTVIRCDRRFDGLYSIGLETENVSPPPKAQRPLASRKTKILFLLFGIVGLLIVTFMPL
jgi:hypothetical protein